jgi:sigma-B regulation protein RsbU (phosphoserine phosphatase)
MRKLQAPHNEGNLALAGAIHVHNALTAPPAFRASNFDIAWATSAAHHVSGDFVVHFQYDQFHYFALGDLMGKGLSAAMWLTHVLDVLYRTCESDNNLSSIMRNLNREIHHSRVGVPLTSLLLTRMKEGDPSVSYSCGGCPPVFLLGCDRRVSVLHEGGPILGALPEAEYKSDTLTLCPGDTMLSVSDGILEVHRGHDFELRPDRIIDHLRYSAGNTAPSIVRGLISRVETSSPSLADDLTVLAIQRQL